jgi:hypothetical protein
VPRDDRRKFFDIVFRDAEQRAAAAVDFRLARLGVVLNTHVAALVIDQRRSLHVRHALVLPEGLIQHDEEVVAVVHLAIEIADLPALTELQMPVGIRFPRSGPRQADARAGVADLRMVLVDDRVEPFVDRFSDVARRVDDFVRQRLLFARRRGVFFWNRLGISGLLRRFKHRNHHVRDPRAGLRQALAEQLVIADVDQRDEPDVAALDAPLQLAEQRFRHDVEWIERGRARRWDHHQAGSGAGRR